MNGVAADALSGKTILVVEDEYLIGQDIVEAFRAAGATVIGCVTNTADARRSLADGTTPDIAVLNIKLRGETVFDLAGELADAGIKFMFVSGYDATMLPERFRHRPRCEKPVQSDALLEIARRALAASQD